MKRLTKRYVFLCCFLNSHAMRPDNRFAGRVSSLAVDSLLIERGRGVGGGGSGGGASTEWLYYVARMTTVR